MLLLCLESSCDETSAAVVRDGRDALSNVIASQVDVHRRYGGVVPELASRRHLEAVLPVIREALEVAGVTLDEIEGVCVTRGPGLIGALLVALSTAKAIAYARKLPLIGVHHIEGHLHAIQLEQEVAYPYLALAVSGGHTHLYLVSGVGDYQILGMTLDDAAGEAFDKVAKLLGLGYPGGVEIDRRAPHGNPKAFAFPRPMLHSGNLKFSFSGLKTSVAQTLQTLPDSLDEQQLCDVSASFQAAVVEVLVRKTLAAAREHDCTRLVVCGGVACNSGLREAFHDRGEAAGLEVHFPSPLLCSDNAAMLGVAADSYLRSGCHHSFDVNAVASWPLDLAGRELLALSRGA